MKTIILATVGCSVLIIGQGNDGKRIIGKWKATHVERDGKELSKLVGSNRTFSASEMKVFGKPFNVIYKYTLSAKMKPKMISWQLGDGVWKGIYELKGDTLKICHGDVRKPAPKEFKTKAGQNAVLWVFKRVK